MFAYFNAMAVFSECDGLVSIFGGPRFPVECLAKRWWFCTRSQLEGPSPRWFGRRIQCVTGCVRSAAWTDLAVSGPETGKRKRVTRKADGKLTLLVNLGVWARKADALGYPFQLTHFRATEAGPRHGMIEKTSKKFGWQGRHGTWHDEWRLTIVYAVAWTC